MAGSIYNETGASTIHLTLWNNTRSVLQLNAKPAKVFLETDYKRLAFTTHLGEYRSVATTADINGTEGRLVKFAASGLTTALLYDNGSAVGIDTASPGAKLSINGGLHVGGDSDPGNNNLLVDGLSTLTGGALVPTNAKIEFGDLGRISGKSASGTIEAESDFNTFVITSPGIEETVSDILALKNPTYSESMAGTGVGLVYRFRYTENDTFDAARIVAKLKQSPSAITIQGQDQPEHTETDLLFAVTQNPRDKYASPVDIFKMGGMYSGNSTPYPAYFASANKAVPGKVLNNVTPQIDIGYLSHLYSSTDGTALILEGFGTPYLPSSIIELVDINGGTNSKWNRICSRAGMLSFGNVSDDGAGWQTLKIQFVNLPTSNPGVSGQLWNSSGQLMVSAG
jgi:hypothetical protein